MLKTACTNPQILAALSKGGHGDKVLISSANFPVEYACGGNVPIVHLELRPNLPDSIDVLKVLTEMIPVEKAEVLLPAGAPPAAIFPLYSEALGGMELTTLPLQEFYGACSNPRVCLAISTGDLRPLSNIMLTIGVVRA